jgi:hypothetical protein
MSISLSEKRQIENEMIFRRANEKVGDDFDELDVQLIEEGHSELTQPDNLALYLDCECSDENCTARIPIQLRLYRDIHKDRNTFIVKPNHQVRAIEEVLHTGKEYSIVEKNHSVAEPDDTLNKTSIDNS